MKLATKSAVAGVLVVVLGLSAYTLYLRHQIGEKDRAIAGEIERTALSLGAVTAKALSQAALTERLGKQNLELVQALKRIDKRVVPVVHVGAVASIEDTVVLGPDEHRFTLASDLKSIQRRQQFRLDLVIVQNVDRTRLGKMTFEELDPVTGAVLPGTPALDMKMEVVNEIPDVGVVHPRAVAGIESHGYPIAGVQVLNGERFGGLVGHLNLSLFGGYNVKDRVPFGGAVLGYRPFNWNVSIGPAVFLGKAGVSYGAAAAIELTR